MLDNDEISRRRAARPHDWSVVDSWSKYVATGDMRILQDEIGTNPESDVTTGFLYFAFGDRDLRVLEMLAESGVSFQETDDPWAIDSILCNAMEQGGDCPDVVCWLLDHGASKMRCTMNRWTPLHVAAIRNYPQVIAVLLERGVNVDVGTVIDGDWTPLMEACRAGAKDSVAILLKHGADPTRCCRMIGTSTVKIAKDAKQSEIVTMLEDAMRSLR
jgi:hypothetical protein